MKPGCWKYVCGRLRPRFTLRGMLVFVAILAVGLASVDRARSDWWDVPWTMLTVWASWWLISDGLRICRRFRGKLYLAGDDHTTWKLAVGSRFTGAGMLFGTLIVNYLLSHKLILLPEDESNYWDVGELARDAIFWLLLIGVLVALPARRIVDVPRSIWAHLISLLAAPLAFLWALRVWLDESIVPFLVYLAIMGIERSDAPIFLPPDLDWNTIARSQIFVRYSCLVVAPVALNFLCVIGLARRRPRFWPVQATLWSLLLVGLSCTLVYARWLLGRGLYQLCPAFREAILTAPAQAWISALVMVAVFISFAVHRLLASPAGATPACVNRLYWRRGTSQHTAFQWAFPTMLIMLMLARLGETVVRELLSEYGNLYWTPESLLWVPFYLPAATLLLSLRATWIAWRHPVRMRNMSLTVISARRFAVIWLALFATIVTAAPALAGFSFSLWLTPWWKLPLPEY